ncbi:O-antigen ligase family protein [Microvirga massiliensis]|uniref:O-antigen ligase family protein n=1 Tax=Microvirga massiliensis TaxID=1033741 RepID=UPI00062BBF89|nr:O-antigen ligase family protein [Microvirga massiliensis]
MEAESVPTFPPYVVLGVFLTLLPITIITAHRFKDGATRFLIAAIWLRYLMSAFHQYTFPPVIGGLSLNALASVAFIAVGFMITDWRFLGLKGFAGIYLMIIVLVTSSIINGITGGAIANLAKWGYLVTLTVAAYQTLRRHGSVPLFRALLTVFLAPLVLQALSVLLGMGKGSEDDGSICFIGGYNHEGAFSILTLTFLYCACFLEPDRPKLTLACIPIALVSLFLANYRTSILAALPVLAAAMFFGMIRRSSPRDRPLVVIVIGLTGLMLFLAAGIAVQQRFNDLFVVLSNSGNLIKPPEYYTTAESGLLSARALIWSRYITAYLNGRITNLAFGFGPESWEGVFPRYAHNTFVSILYEAGAFGLASMVLLFAWNFRLAARATLGRRPLTLGAHAGFLVLNLATMGLWQIEGNVLLALTLAYTLHVQAPRRVWVPQRQWKMSTG